MAAQLHSVMRINLIYARARNGVIGRDNALPWHLPEDLAHFKRLTAGCPVIMGRKTWDSLPPRFRPLPGRRNLVVTRQRHWSADGAIATLSLQHALDLCAASNPTAAEVWITGGAELYAQASALAHRAVVTELAQDFEGDAFAPQLDARWVETGREEHRSNNGMQFAFVSYINNSLLKES